MKTHLPLATAHTLAQQLIDRFAPDCERIEVAGAVMRGEPEVSAIELIIVSRPTLNERLGVLLDSSKVAHASPRQWSDDYKAFVMRVSKDTEIKVDLFFEAERMTTSNPDDRINGDLPLYVGLTAADVERILATDYSADAARGAEIAQRMKA